jgi:hypothetical protein
MLWCLYWYLIYGLCARQYPTAERHTYALLSRPLIWKTTGTYDKLAFICEKYKFNVPNLCCKLSQKIGTQFPQHCKNNYRKTTGIIIVQ